MQSMTEEQLIGLINTALEDVQMFEDDVRDEIAVQLATWCFETIADISVQQDGEEATEEQQIEAFRKSLAAAFRAGQITGEFPIQTEAGISTNQPTVSSTTTEQGATIVNNYYFR